MITKDIRVFVLVAVLITAVSLFFRPVETFKVSQDYSSANTMEQEYRAGDFISQNADGSYFYDGKYFSVQYPSNWYFWSFGKGVSLEHLQIHSVPPESDLVDTFRSTVDFDIQEIGYSQADTLDEYSIYLENGFKQKNTVSDFVIGRQNFKGVEAVIHEYSVKDSTGLNEPSYLKQVWFIKDEIKYIISWRVAADSIDALDQIIERDTVLFDAMLDSFEIKNPEM